MLNGIGARELYEGLTGDDRAGASDDYRDVIAAWLDRARGRYLASLAVAAECNRWWAECGTDDELASVRWELYALSRVSDALLLSRQPSEEPATVWKSEATTVSKPEPALADHEYLGLFTALGMTPFSGGVFDPFLHEIVEVEQAEDPGTPIVVTEVVWPGLMLGDLLFNRAGVRVRAGAQHAQRGAADRSPLYWTFRRRYRPTVDLSHGWGGNSQWRTGLRLDYRTSAGDRLNVEGDRPIDGSTRLGPDHPADLGPQERLLTPQERRVLLRHRCLLRMPEAAVELAAFAGWETEFMPFGWLPDEGCRVPVA